MTGPSDPIRLEPDFETSWPGAQRSATEVVLNLGRAGETVGAMVDQVVRRHGVPSRTALVVLEILRGSDEPLTPSQIAQRSFVGGSTLSGVFTTLQRHGLVERMRSAADGRSFRLTITPEGIRTVESALLDLHRAEAEWVSGLSAKEREALIRGLARIPARRAAD